MFFYDNKKHKKLPSTLLCAKILYFIFLSYSKTHKLFRVTADSCRHFPEIETLLFRHLTNKKNETKPLLQFQTNKNAYHIACLSSFKPLNLRGFVITLWQHYQVFFKFNLTTKSYFNDDDRCVIIKHTQLLRDDGVCVCSYKWDKHKKK